MSARYVTTSTWALARELRVIRARLEDVQTGELLDCRTAAGAARIGDALTRADAGDIPPEEVVGPAGRYVIQVGSDGRSYLWRGDGIVPDRCFARTKSAEFAGRVTDVLNRLDPFAYPPDDGTVKAAWF